MRCRRRSHGRRWRTPGTGRGLRGASSWLKYLPDGRRGAAPPGSVDVADLVAPEALEALEGSVHGLDPRIPEHARFLEAARVALEEAGDDIANLAAAFGEAHADRAAVDLAALVVHVARLDELLEVVGDVRALVVAAGLQLARGDLVVADVEQQERLHGVDVEQAEPLELVFHDVEQEAVQAFDEGKAFEVFRVEPLCDFGQDRLL